MGSGAGGSGRGGGGGGATTYQDRVDAATQAVVERYSPRIREAAAEETRALEALRRAQGVAGDAAVNMGRDRFLSDGRSNSRAGARVRNARQAYEQARRNRDALIANRERLIARVVSRIS